MNQGLPVSPKAIMAAAVLHAKKRDTQLEIEGMSQLFLDLEQRGIGLGHVALRKVPGGVYSADAEAFVGRFLAAGYATARSPIDFGEKGLSICRDIIRRERERNPENLQTALSALGFDAP
jgi:hypothetical protein